MNCPNESGLPEPSDTTLLDIVGFGEVLQTIPLCVIVDPPLLTIVPVIWALPLLKFAYPSVVTVGNVAEVGVGVGVGVLVGVSVLVGVGVLVGVTVLVGVSVLVGVTVLVGVWLGVIVGPNDDCDVEPTTVKVWLPVMSVILVGDCKNTVPLISSKGDVGIGIVELFVTYNPSLLTLKLLI